MLLVDREGNVTRRLSCIPLIQQIPKEGFKGEIKGLPRKIRRRLAQSYEIYANKPSSSVADITEVVEGLVLQAGREAVRKTWINVKDAKPGYPAATLDALMAVRNCNPAMAALGGARSYIDQYRNVSHHFPKDKKQAYKKYEDCKHGFTDGIKRIHHFREGMEKIGMTGTLP